MRALWLIKCAPVISFAIAKCTYDNLLFVSKHLNNYFFQLKTTYRMSLVLDIDDKAWTKRFLYFIQFGLCPQNVGVKAKCALFICISVRYALSISICNLSLCAQKIDGKGELKYWTINSDRESGREWVRERERAVTLN